MRPGTTRRGVVAATLTAALLVLAACGDEQAPVGEVQVRGELGQRPELAFETPFEVDRPVVEVLVEGTGPELVEGEPVLLDFYAESGADGSLVGETYSAEPKPYLLTPEALGTQIHRALSGRTVGTRLLHLVPGEGPAESTTIAVFDIRPTRAAGEPVEPREGLPGVELSSDGVPTVTVPDAPPPGELVVQTLQRGPGPQVQPGQVITVQYLGVAWSTGETFDSTWERGRLPAPFPIGVGSVLPGWDAGLVEQTVGSQMLLVVPPDLGYGTSVAELVDETLVFVVDILAASGGPKEE